MLRPPPHLKHRREFLHVSRAGRRIAKKGFILQVLDRDDPGGLRVGTTVTRKVGNAVIRNRTRRRLRELARLVLAEQSRPASDIVLVGRGATRTMKFSALIADLRCALERAGLA